jgi:hypothetical protein
MQGNYATPLSLLELQISHLGQKTIVKCSWVRNQTPIERYDNAIWGTLRFTLKNIAKKYDVKLVRDEKNSA